MTYLIDPERMTEILTEALSKLKAKQGLVEESWKPFSVEW